MSNVDCQETARPCGRERTARRGRPRGLEEKHPLRVSIARIWHRSSRGLRPLPGSACGSGEDLSRMRAPLRRRLRVEERGRERALFLGQLRTRERGLLRRQERGPLRVEERGLVREQERGPLRREVWGQERVPLRLEELRPEQGPLKGPERGQERVPHLGPERHLLRGEERGPVRGPQLPPRPRGRAFGDRAIQNSELGDQKPEWQATRKRLRCKKLVSPMTKEGGPWTRDLSRRAMFTLVPITHIP